MKNKKIAVFLSTAVAAVSGALLYHKKKKQKEDKKEKTCTERKITFYEAHAKRTFDVICASMAILVFGWLYLLVALLVRIKLGSPVLFKQPRPGKDEKVFNVYKFRTMTDERDENCNLLPDEVRLTKFGKALRATSLDELPEAFNILKGDMSIVGPRPQLVRDMVFMTDEQRKRHDVRPGLSGLAQVNGRNDIDWEDKLNWDLKYIQKITFLGDIKIILQTVLKAFVKQEGITEGDMATAEDFGDYLLHSGKVSQEEYDQKQEEAKCILGEEDTMLNEEELVSIIMPSYNTASYIQETVESVLKQTYTNWELIIVDDCSTDDTDDILATFTDKRIRIYKNEKNSGAAVSRNKALREANGKWIAFLDSDDLWSKDKLEKQITFMKKNGYSFSYTNYEEINTEGQKTGVKVTGPKKITKTGMFNYCWPGCLTVMYDAEKVGLIQIEDIKKNNDYAMWLKVCKKADCYLLDEYLAQYRKGRSGSISTHSIKTMIGWHYRLYRVAENLSKLSSFISTGRNLMFGFYKKKRYVKKNKKFKL